MGKNTDKVERKRMISLLSILATVIFLSSCEKSDPNDLGRLQVTIYYNNEIVVNAAVAIASTQKELDAGIYISEIRTDIYGVASFGAIAPGTYYYDSYYYINNNQTYLYAKDVIKIAPGHKYNLDLILTEL
ncbi:MAG: hypothetical protein H8E61_11600 [Bacteroidetes bacterium]|nr:hypothetical protein [Bacteroidota bacterium]